MNVAIRLGQPFFAYPEPDHLITNRSNVVYLSFDTDWVKSNANWTDSFRSFDWLLGRLEETRVRHAYYGWVDKERQRRGEPRSPFWPPFRLERVTVRPTATVGLRYGGLVVTPNKPAWANIASIKASNHQWWSDLRQVPSSWVTSHGETERFLYYDGPTKLPAPFHAQLTDGKLAVSSGIVSDHVDQILKSDFYREQARQQGFEPLRQPNQLFETRAESEMNDALYVVCDQESTKAYVISKMQVGTYDFTTLKSLGREAAEEKLTTDLVGNGLTQEESLGLIKAWRGEFFDRPGRRLIYIMNAAEYNNYCPINVKPKPTEMIRVGLILSPI